MDSLAVVVSQVVVKPGSTEMDLNPVHPAFTYAVLEAPEGMNKSIWLRFEKKFPPTLGGVILIEVTRVIGLFLKALFPILVTLLGIVTLVNRFFQKAFTPILVTLFGIVTLVKAFFLKALLPILVTV